MDSQIQTIQDYIEAQDENIQSVLTELHQIIKEAIPEADEKIAWSMPTYYKGSPILHFAAYNHHISLHVGSDVISKFSKELEPFDTSKACIKMAYQEPLPKALITAIAKWSYQEYSK